MKRTISKVRRLKRYDAARTPYQRLLAAGEFTHAQRHTLEQFLALNPAALARQIDHTLDTLWKLRDSDRPRDVRRGYHYL